MTNVLSRKEVLNLAHFASEILAGKQTTANFFRYWPDLSPDEDKAVRDLWYEISSLEIDEESATERSSTKDYYLLSIAELVADVEKQFSIWPN